MTLWAGIGLLCSRGVALPACRARRLSGWRASAMTACLPPRHDGPPSWRSFLPATKPTSSRDPSAACSPRTMPGRSASFWSTTAAATARPPSRKAIKSGRRLDVVAGTDLPAGWTGKLWALEQGIRHATAAGDAIDYFLLTDADIGHAPDNLSRLVARAELDGRVQVSLMAELSCATLAERFLIPAFVYFFQMLYPVRLGRASAIARRPLPPAAARWCAARRWSVPAASPPSGPRSSTIVRWRVASRARARSGSASRGAPRACGPTAAS